jgi:hypothetical protein
MEILIDLVGGFMNGLSAYKAPRAAVHGRATPRGWRDRGCQVLVKGTNRTNVIDLPSFYHGDEGIDGLETVGDLEGSAENPVDTQAVLDLQGL